MNRFVSLLLLTSVSVGAVQAEWFDKGSTSYRTPDGKWRKAAIEVTPDAVRVYTRKRRSLVARFESTKHFKGDSGLWSWERKYYAGMTFLGGASVVGLLALPVEPGWKTTCYHYEYSTSCDTRWSDGRDPLISAKSALISLGVMAGIAAAVAYWPSRTDYTFKDGPRRATVRVAKRDRDRFESALKAGVFIERSGSF